MNAAQSIADILQLYGGWGVSAVLVVSVWAMARHVMKLNSARLEDQKRHNEELLHAAERRIEADLKHAEAFKSLREVILRLIERM